MAGEGGLKAVAELIRDILTTGEALYTQLVIKHGMGADEAADEAVYEFEYLYHA